VLCFCFVFLRLVYPMLPGFLDYPFGIFYRLFRSKLYMNALKVISAPEVCIKGAIQDGFLLNMLMCFQIRHW